jgi:hypothetical protein
MKTKPEKYTPEELKTYADGLSAAMCIGTMLVCVILLMLRAFLAFILIP